MSKSRWTAVDFIANAKRPSGYSAGDVVDFIGWEDSGDGGAAQWVATGNKIAASQGPADLVDIKLSDASGNEFELMTASVYNAMAVGVLTSNSDNGPAMRALHSVERTVSYPAGRINISGTVQMPFGTTIETAGWETEFWFSGMTESTDCFEVVRGGAGFERFKNLYIGRHKLVLVDSNARYGWGTPVDSNIFIIEKPHIEIFCQSMAPDRAATVTPYSFESIIKLGDCRSGRVELYGSGGYPTLTDDTGARASDGITLEGATGNVGVKMKAELLAIRKGLNLKDGVEGFQIEGEFAQCIIGVDSDEQTSVVFEPGGFIDNMHVNARDAGYRLKNRAEISIGAATAYKSDAFYDDGSSEWVGFDMGDQVSCRIGEVGAYPGASFNKARNTAVRYRDGSYENKLGHVDSRNCGKIVDIGSTETLDIDSAHSVNGTIGYNITGTPTNVVLGPVRERSTPLIADFVLMAGTVDRSEVNYNQELCQIESFKTTVVTAAGSVTLNPINDAKEQNFVVQQGTGAYTYDIMIDDTRSAVLGTEFKLKLNMPSSTNPTVRIVRASDSAVLSTINVASSIRLVGEYLFTTNGLFEKRAVFESLETSY